MFYSDPATGGCIEGMTTYRVSLNGGLDFTIDCDEFMVGSDGEVTFYADDDTTVAYVPASSLSHIVREQK